MPLTVIVDSPLDIMCFVGLSIAVADRRAMDFNIHAMTAFSCDMLLPSRTGFLKKNHECWALLLYVVACMCFVCSDNGDFARAASGIAWLYANNNGCGF